MLMPTHRGVSDTDRISSGSPSSAAEHVELVNERLDHDAAIAPARLLARVAERRVDRGLLGPLELGGQVLRLAVALDQRIVGDVGRDRRLERRHPDQAHVARRRAVARPGARTPGRSASSSQPGRTRRRRARPRPPARRRGCTVQSASRPSRDARRARRRSRSARGRRRSRPARHPAAPRSAPPSG